MSHSHRIWEMLESETKRGDVVGKRQLANDILKIKKRVYSRVGAASQIFKRKGI